MQAIADYAPQDIMAAPAPVSVDTAQTYRRVKLDDVQNTTPSLSAAKATVRHWAAKLKDVEERAPSLVLLGPPGVGKSMIARAIYDAWTYQPQDGDGNDDGPRVPVGVWYSARSLMELLQHDREDGRSMSSRFPYVPLIIVDDVGAEGVLPYVAADMQEIERQNRYWHLLEHCIAHDVALVITTNLNVEGLKAHMGMRCWDRLLQLCPAGFMIGLFDVPSYRQKLGGR